jgi:hypothetical protein
VTELERAVREDFLGCSNYRPEDPTRTTNGGGFCNARFDRLVAQAKALQPTDPTKAQGIWARADRLRRGALRRAGQFTLDANNLPQMDQLWVS